MRIRPYVAEDRQRWEAYVNGSSEASLYHRIDWKALVEESFGHRTHYWLAEDSQGEIRGILPLVHLKSLLFGSFMVSLPYFNYGGICADDDSVRTALLETAVERAAKDKAAHIELRHQARMKSDLPMKTAKVSMRLPLPSGADELFQGFDAKLRSQVRRPIKEGMTARIEKAEGLDGFYKIFSRNMRDLGTPVYSRDFFKNILERFPESSWICTVYKEGIPVASGFLVGFKETLEIPWASSLKAYNRYSPNMLLYWAALKFACESGMKFFDFGRSTPDEGSYRFKAQWGAQPVPLYWYYWTRNGGALPDLNPKNPKYHAAIALWKRLPVSLTRMLGPSIVRNLP